MQTEQKTMVEVLNDLKKEGFTHDFNIHNNNIHSSEGNITLSPKDFEIVKVYRFEGMSDPGDNSVVYAVESTKHGVKGTFINASAIASPSNIAPPRMILSPLKLYPSEICLTKSSFLAITD